jgi:protein SCO1/2
VQPLTLKAGVVFVIAGAGLVLFFREERARMERKRIATATKGIGKPKVGGPFELIDTNGKPFSHEDMKDKYGLVCVFPGRCAVLRGPALLWLHALPGHLP